MGAMPARDVSDSFAFMGDMNNHHREWLGSTTTNRYGFTALNIAKISSCNKLLNIMSDLIGKVVASHAEVARSIPG